LIGVAILVASLAQEAGAPTPVPGDCSKDPLALAERARTLLDASAAPSEETIMRARSLLRAARRSGRSAALDLAAADLAFAAGDPEEGGDLLAAAADADPRLALTPAELALLARRAEERRRWRDAIERYDALRKALAGSGEPASWISARIRELEIEARAASIAPPPSAPPVEARLALADGKRALAAGDLRAAREKLRLAARLSPGYVDALLALSATETRAGRPAEALRAARDAVAAEPDRVEAITALASLLWAEPDRRAKEEALGLFDRAAALRPGEPALLRLSAERYAELGDAARALERLDRYLAVAAPREKAELAPLRDALSRRTGGGGDAAGAAGEDGGEPASEAVDRWRKAQVLAGSGDRESLTAALALAGEAERLDPSFPQAAELSASIHRRLGDRAAAESALARAIRADPARAAPREDLARLLEEDPARRADAAAAWRAASEAGSTEALVALARAAEADGRSGEALRLYRRYRDEAPAGLHAADATEAVARLEQSRSRRQTIFAALALAAAGAAGFAIHRRRSGRTLEEFLAEHPARVHRVRPIVGRLRHEALKHGGLLLPDVARRLREADPAVRRDAAQLALRRLFGESGGQGLVAEARAAMAELAAVAREEGARLNLERRDPAFARLARGLDALSRARPSLERVADSEAASEESAARAAEMLSRAAREFGLASGAGIERMLDRASALPVRLDALQDLLSRVAAEAALPRPRLEPLGALAGGGRLPSVRIAPLDWETLWRNLFSNAIAAGRARVPEPVRLGFAAEERRDAATGELRLSVVLADDLPGALTTEALRSRPAERGWGVIADLLRRNDASFEVVAAPAPGFSKGIALDLPAIETTA
jgi:hypothetical protein